MPADRRVLVVDDDVDFADSLREMLESEQYEVITAHSIPEALAAAESSHPQVALLDIRLRGSGDDGLALLGALKKIDPFLPVIIMTAFADIETAIKALQGSAYDYLRKPLFFQELSVTLARCFEQIRLERENRSAAAALAESEERYRSIFENALEGIFRMAPGAGFLDVNPALVQMLGYDSPRDVLALDLRKDLFADPGDFRRLVSLHNASRTADHLEVNWKKRDGDLITVSINSRLVLDPEGRALFYEGMVQDITDRKRAEEKLQRQFQRVAALRAIDLAITASFDLHVILNLMLDQGLPQLGADAAAVLLLNPHLRVLEYAAGRGFWGDEITRTHLPLGDGPAGRAALNRSPIHLANLPGSGDAGVGQSLEKEGFVFAYIIPLVIKGSIKGVFEIFQRSTFALKADWQDFAEMIADQTAIAIDNIALFEDLQRSNTSLVLAYDTTLEGWSRALDLRDRETEGHTQRVTELTLQLSRSIGIPDSELAHIRRGALLHDIGKMAIPDSILMKTGPLTEEEWEVMRRHPVYAYELLSPIDFLRPALDIPYCHHEKWDGSGYPRGLKGEQIPPAARIFAVADVWDALRSGRPYRAPWPREKAVSYLRSQAGLYFDKKYVDVFLRMNL